MANQRSRITIEDTFRYHGGLVFGLFIESYEKFPLVVGCSIKTFNEKIIDIPAKYLLSPGHAVWSVTAPDECARGTGFNLEWNGYIIFALYEDRTFAKRLADTGWIRWHIISLIGSSSAGLDMQDEYIESKYGKRMNVWKPL